LTKQLAKPKPSKNRDEVIDNTTKEQTDIVAIFVAANPDTHIVILPPLMRLEPVWIKDKIRTIYLFLKKLDQTE
jgi:hypothetical protein